MHSLPLSLSLSFSLSRLHSKRYIHTHTHTRAHARARALHIPRRRGGRGQCQRSAVRAQGRPWRRARLGSLPRHTPPPRHWQCGHGNPTPHNNNKKKIKKSTERKKERETERQREMQRGTSYTHKAKKAGWDENVGRVCGKRRSLCLSSSRWVPPPPRSDWNGLWSEVPPSQTHTETYIRRVTVTMPTSEVWGNFSGSSPPPLLSLSDLPPTENF